MKTKQTNKTQYSELTIEKYKLLLQSFVDLDGMREWLKAPFQYNKKAVASDGEKMILLPLYDETLIDHTEKLNSFIPKTHLINFNIEVQDLKTAIEQHPRIDCYDEETLKCDACYGNGEVEFEYSYYGEEYSIDAECPVCEGSGNLTKTKTTPNGETDLDDSKYIQIRESMFRPPLIQSLISVAETLEAETITLVNQNPPRSGSMFTIKEAEVIIMPIYISDFIEKEGPAYTITLKEGTTK